MPQGVTARAAGDLLDLVLDRTFPSGSALPSETELAKRLGVSRLTMREAIKSLTGTRVILVRHGFSSVVNPVHEWSPLEPRLFAARVAQGCDALPAQILEVRRLVEVEALSLVVQRRTAAQCERLADALRVMRVAHAADDLDNFVEHCMRFQTELIAATGNVCLEALLSPLIDIVRPAAYEAHIDPALRQQVLVLHQEVLDATVARDGPRARSALAGHFDRQRSDPMWSRLRRTMKDRDGALAPSPTTTTNKSNGVTGNSADAMSPTAAP